MKKEELEKKIKGAKDQIINLEDQLNDEIQKSKPILQLDFLSTKELVDNIDPLGAKTSQNKIKTDLKELNRLINYLWR